MKSMTGYGKAKLHENDIDLEIEIKSINGRYLDIRLYLPREISFFEHVIRKRISSFICRGTMEFRVSYSDHRDPQIELNTVKLKKYYDLVQKASAALNLNNDISLEFLMNEPGIIESVNQLDEDSILKDMLDKTLELAIAELNKSLVAEADGMRQTLSASTTLMLQTLEKIEAEIKPYKDELFVNMKNRTSELLQSYNTENLEQRLFQELAIYIDKYDIHEEITRLRSHISTLIETLGKTEDIGKSLNFILQEMQREANTLGSKFSTAKTFVHILTLKEEVEKCREIVQNVA